ncbi:MAG: arginase, partial [Bacteroidia bacterium]
MNRDVVIVENPSEVGAGTRGAGAGPFAVRLQDNQTGNLVYGRYPHMTVDTFNAALCNPVQTPHAKYMKEIVDQNNRLIDVLTPLLETAKFPIVLSGDH